MGCLLCLSKKILVDIYKFYVHLYGDDHVL